MPQLVLVLEFAPGVELFDAILSKKSFTEEEARPVFVQVRDKPYFILFCFYFAKYFIFLKPPADGVKLRLKLPHFHVSNKCRASI